MPTPHPVSLALTDAGGLHIGWSDGQTREYTPGELYDASPAADVRAEKLEAEQKAREHTRTGPAGLQLTVMSPEEATPRRVVGMKPVGNYGYAVQFNHGSNNGIYRFELLRELGRELPAEATDSSPSEGPSSDGTSSGRSSPST